MWQEIWQSKHTFENKNDSFPNLGKTKIAGDD